MRNIRGNLPNFLTMINMSLGVMAILLAVSDPGKKHLFIASLLVMVAALTDRFDGKVARMLDATSELGKELDSLSDLISFGVAPIVIAWKISFGVHWGIAGYLISLIFPMAGAYRLARFNITTFDKVFRGIPITIAGSFLAIDNLYNCWADSKNKLTDVHSYVAAGLIILLSYFMVSKIKFKKF